MMKKLLGIVVLGLFCCNITFALSPASKTIYFDQCYIKSKPLFNTNKRAKQYCACYTEMIHRKYSDEEFEKAFYLNRKQYDLDLDNALNYCVDNVYAPKIEKPDLKDGPGRCIGYITMKFYYEGKSSITKGNINYKEKNKDEFNLITELNIRVKKKNLCGAGKPYRQCLIDFSEYEKELYIDFATGGEIYHKVKNKPTERSVVELACSDFDYLND